MMTNDVFMVFMLRPGLEPSTVWFGGRRANHYATATIINTDLGAVQWSQLQTPAVKIYKHLTFKFEIMQVKVSLGPNIYSKAI